MLEHKKHVTRNLNDLHNETLTFGDKVADGVVSGMGSWKFIIIQTAIVALWIVLNVWILSHPFDPFPLILLNLVFSTQAAYASPLILMSQNRSSAKDRLMAENDYHLNVKAEEETRQIILQLQLSIEKHNQQIELIQLGNTELLKQTKYLIDMMKKLEIADDAS
jgi:uncharacterized membrane protein